MPELNQYDLQWCVRRLPPSIRRMIKREIVVVAGGFIRACISGEKLNDIDMFVDSKEYAEQLAAGLVGDDKKRLRKTDNAITLKGFSVTPQFITRWVFDTPREAIDSFDFTICQAAFWWDHYCQKWCSVVGDQFYQDLAAKRLIYTNPVRSEDIGGSMLRILKYYQRGYRTPLSSLSDVITRLVGGVNLGPENMTEQTEHGICVSPVEFSRVIKGLLVEVDPALDPDHIVED